MRSRTSRLIGLFAMVGGTTAAAATYETKLVNQQEFLVGKEGAIEVWLSPVRTEEEIGAHLVIVNGSDEAIDVHPERVRGEAVTATPKGEQRRQLRTYSAKQYEDILRRRNWTTGSLQDDRAPSMRGGGLPKRPDRGSETDAFRRAWLDCESGDSAACRWLSERGIPGHLVGFSYPLPKMAMDQRGDFKPLLHPGHLSAHASCSGAVYMKHRPADRYHISVPLAGATFEFDFTLPPAR